MSELKPWQERAFSQLFSLQSRGEASAALLYGVTGSGKTAVYLRLIRETIQMGKQALVLVNYANATLADVQATYQAVQQDVYQKFGIHLEPEPVLFNDAGLIIPHNTF